ncbi:hypothetical protein GCM10010121_074970 [Streptomyces brasiliensis]|uniref:Transposase DDE domain-containing protein n=1 Tax=Streptomyces brasiliensis TaxID=1954 RepID=A0A917P1R8_9ACTN|nr:hypothetical protein GCM10010121_074970 [Streptomyces brasiliensis]
MDIDDTIRRTYGYAKQGAGYGYSKVKGLNALLGIVSTPLSAPVIAATRLRKGPTNSARGAAAFVTESIRTARASGAAGLLIVRADSGFYGADVINACRALDACFSVTVRMNTSIKAAIAGIDEAAWKAIKYPKAVGRRGEVLDLGRGDSRDHLHRLHLQAEETAGHRPPDRAPRQAPQTRGDPRGAGHAFRHLALSRRVHQLPALPGRCRA